MKAHYIDDSESLAQLCDTLANEPVVAVDTEFFRETSYYPKLGLIQLASAGHIACVDPLAVDARMLLAGILCNRNITKIFHACVQDLEVLFHYLGELPCPVIDTQIAAALLGEQEQVGYAGLVAQRLAIQLNKSETRTNWLRRPLSEKQIEYALDDVRYLIPLHDSLLGELTDRQRDSWLTAECNVLCASSDRFQPDLENCWKRVKGTSRLAGNKLAIVDAVARWREQLAIEKDLTRRKIMPDNIIIDIAHHQAASSKALSAIGFISEKFNAKQIDFLACAIDEKLRSDPASWPTNDFERLNPDEKTLLKAVLDRLKNRAGKLGIAPSILCSRKEAERLVRGERDLPVLSNWRRTIVGEELLAITDA